jgi:DNA invertase Pin-like site-specific DNA recombinase
MSINRKGSNRAEKKELGSSKIALIYCRVSSERQKTEGHGLDSQEHRCREYALTNGYSIEKVFRDSYSGGGDFMLRPAMGEMIGYIDKNLHKNYIVIFDDLKRFARDTEFHLKLRTALRVRNVKPECLNYTFDDTAEGTFVETVFAAQGQLERDQNKRQVVQKMKARLESGYWTFFPPPGYIHIKDPIHGKLLVPTDKAPIIKEVFEGFASGRFREQNDVKKFLQEQRFNNRKYIWLETVKRLLTRVIYAGYIEYPKWNVERRKGHHQEIISLETYDKVQEKLGNRTFKRIIENEDFPMRGLVICSDCHRPMTAGWSKGRSKKYPFYKCQHIYCKSKDVRKEVIEGEFEKLLNNIKPKEEAVLLSEVILKDIWKKRMVNLEDTVSNLKRHRDALERNNEKLVDTLTKMQSEAVMKVIEAKVDRNNEEIKNLNKQIENRNINSESYGTAAETVMTLLKNPVFTWNNGGYKGKRLVTKLVFTENPVYDRKLHYGTAELSVGIRLFELISAQKTQDVEMPRIELGCK